MQFPFLAVVGKPQPLPDDIVRRCKDAREALLLVIDQRVPKRTEGDVAALIGMSKQHFSKVLLGKGHFPTAKIRALQEVCGNLAFTQYMNMECGLVARYETDSERIARLESELASVRALQA